MKFLFLILFTYSAFAQTFKHEVLLEQKSQDVIWGFDFLSDGKVIFTERGGKIHLFDPKTKKVTELTGAPKVHAAGQGGMLDIRVHPKNGFIYLTWSEPKGKKQSATALGRFKLKDHKITEFKKIFEASANSNDYHYGSRIEFVDDSVFITSGERGVRKDVQKMDNTFGKVIRMKEDGSGMEIWSKGLRSPQGLALRPGTNELWEAEMGPQGGDELNIIKKDANYGWPLATYGEEYGGGKIGDKTLEGTEAPIVYWVPSISPSGMTFWNGEIWLGTLSGEHLRRLILNGQKIVKQEKYLDHLSWRFRNVRPGPDNQLWFSTDEGRIGRLIRSN